MIPINPTEIYTSYSISGKLKRSSQIIFFVKTNVKVNELPSIYNIGQGYLF